MKRSLALILGLVLTASLSPARAEESPAVQLLGRVQKCYRELPGFTMEGKAWTLDPRMKGERSWILQFARPDRVLWRGQSTAGGRSMEVTLVSDGEVTRRYQKGDPEPRQWPASLEPAGVLDLGLGLDGIWLLLAQGSYHPSPEALEYRGRTAVEGQDVEVLFIKRGFSPCDLYLYIDPATGLIRYVKVDDSEGWTAGFAALRYTSLEAAPAQAFQVVPGQE